MWTRHAPQVFTPGERELARQMRARVDRPAQNEGDLLPLNKSLGSIAVIGPNADVIRNLVGDYAYPAHIETILEQHSDNPSGGARPIASA